jgi:hypothetical protein
MGQVEESRSVTDRRSFLLNGAAVGAGAIGASRLLSAPPVSASGRLTKGDVALELTVDTSWWTRYRSDSKNPDLGDTPPQAVPGLAVGKYPAIPRSDDDLTPHVARTAGGPVIARARSQVRRLAVGGRDPNRSLPRQHPRPATPTCRQTSERMQHECARNL